MNINSQRDYFIQQQRLKDFERQMADEAKNMPLTASDQYSADVNRITRQRQAIQKNSPLAGFERPSNADLDKRFPFPENPIQTQLKSEFAANPFGNLPKPEWPIPAPSGLLMTLSNDQPQWPVPVPDELVRSGGAGGGMRDSNIQDSTGLTGGGALMTGGAGGGMRDSNIQDATGTTGGNAAAETKDKAFDWDGLASGFGQLGKGLKGMSRTEPDMRAPSLADDSGQRMAAASQLWQAVMQKRKPKGLI